MKLFFESFLTLFNTAWGQLEFTFSDLDIFGEICLIAFTTLSNIMLFNLIVAIVNNLFDSYHEKAEAESRAKLVLAHERKKWDDRYGFYLDDGWIYVYRSYVLIARFHLIKKGDSYTFVNVQRSQEKPECAELAIEEALCSSAHLA